VISKNRKNNGGACLLFSAIFSFCLVYGITTILILRHGTASRGDGIGSADSSPNDHGNNLETHAHLQNHDLSSIFLEGLPPLRDGFQHMYRTNRKLSRGVGKLSELLEDDPLQKVTYLRKRMPID
jgi:hypothetical protein